MGRDSQEPAPDPKGVAMALQFEAYFPDQTATKPTVSVDDVPQEIREEAEEAVNWFVQHVDDKGVLRVVIPDGHVKSVTGEPMGGDAGAQRWLALVSSYCLSRKGRGDAGPWVLKSQTGRKSEQVPGKVAFRLVRKDRYDARLAESARIREANKAAKAAQATA